MSLSISEGPRKGQTVTLRQVTRLVPAKIGATRQIHALTSRDDLPAGEVCWRLSSRWREGELLPLRRTRFALDALDSYAAAPDNPDRMVPNPAPRPRPPGSDRPTPPPRRPRRPGTPRCSSCAALRPGQAATLTNQVVNALAAPVEAAWRDLDDAEQAAAVIPARVPLGTLAPDMVCLDAETKQITHAIRMAAYNAQTLLARGLDGHYARAGDEAYALIREALTASGDIRPGPGELLIRLDPLTAPWRTKALAECPTSSCRRRPLSRNRSCPALRGQIPSKPCIKESLCREPWEVRRSDSPSAVPTKSSKTRHIGTTKAATRTAPTPLSADMLAGAPVPQGVAPAGNAR